MVTLEKKSFGQSELANKYEKGKSEVVTAAGLTFEKITMEPGWQWTKHARPMAKTASCPKSHVLYVISGRLHVKLDDGKEEEFSTGDIAVIPPGHDAWTVGDKAAVALEIPH